jgi:ADP-ribose pyrophosphatase
MEKDPARATVWEGKYLRVKVCGKWEYVERPNSPAGIVIVAVTPEGELLLAEQYRFPMARNVIELPAGLAGDDHNHGEEFLAAAKRELREETGFEAESWEELTDGPPTAGLTNEQVVFFRAKGLKRVGDGGGEEGENIQIHSIPVNQVAEWLRRQKQQRNVSIDPKIFAGLFFLLQEGQSPVS